MKWISWGPSLCLPFGRQIYSIHLVGLTSVLCERPDPKGRSVLNQLFLMISGAFHMKSTTFHEKCCFFGTFCLFTGFGAPVATCPCTRLWFFFPSWPWWIFHTECNSPLQSLAFCPNDAAWRLPAWLSPLLSLVSLYVPLSKPWP